jgi:hypothetical protein
MSDAMRLIVDALVKLNDREALDAMREHRQRLRGILQEKTGGCFDVSRSIEIYDNDIAVVDAGLARL